MASRRIAVVDTDPDPTGYPVAFAVEVASETATDDDPARVEVTVTNRGDEAIEFHTGWPNVFGSPKSEERAPGLILLPPGSPPPVGVKYSGPQSMGYAIPGLLMGFELDPGTSEAIALTVSSQDPTDPPGWLPGGTFAFRANYSVSVADTDEPCDGAFDWGFSLAVDSTA